MDNINGCEGCKHLTKNYMCKANLKEIGEFENCLDNGDCTYFERATTLDEAKRMQCKEMIDRLPYEEIERIRKSLMEIWRKYHKLEDLNS